MSTANHFSKGLLNRLTPLAPWKTTKEQLPLFLYPLVNEPQILTSSHSTLPSIKYLCRWSPMCTDMAIFLLMVLLWMLLWQWCPSNLLLWILVSMYKKVQFLFLGLVGGVVCFFFLCSLFHVFLHCFFLSFMTLPIMLQSFVSPSWSNGHLLNLLVRICIQLGDKKLCMYIAMAVGLLNVSYLRPSWVLCTVKQYHSLLHVTCGGTYMHKIVSNSLTCHVVKQNLNSAWSRWEMRVYNRGWEMDRGRHGEGWQRLLHAKLV
jgi:hypothetical protein